MGDSSPKVLPEGHHVLFDAEPEAMEGSTVFPINQFHQRILKTYRMAMTHATLTEVRNHAKHYFDIVASGETVRVLRNDQPIADMIPIVPEHPAWKRRQAQPLVLEGVSVSRMILEERQIDL